QAALQGRTVMKEDFKITLSREYGASHALYTLMKEIGLMSDIYSRPSEEWVRSSLAMIAGRIIYAGSKLSLSHCGSYSALWEVCGIDNVDVNIHCYEAMDRLLERQDAIQRNLAKKHLQDGMIVLYDITSSYFEGEYDDSDLVEFGYNRDKKRGKEQIVISLLCSKDGCPVAVEVLKGNTKDETMVFDKIAELKEKYGMKKAVFVGDRGMVKKFNYEHVIYTDVTAEDMAACEVVAYYKSLVKVEQAFTNMKTVRLEIHPVYHKTDDRIKCHVFICMLAYYVMWHMKQRLQPLFEIDGTEAGRKYTFDYIMETLKCIRKNTVEFQNAITNVITVPTDEQNRILQLLGISQ
ncbi:MAG: transposase, partial [Firmicutes bacterium]|nr:transposase [Bacillota bacterium]